MSKKQDYEIGYSKPPKATQFKKGQSGNPKGRPKGSNNLSTDVKAILKAPVPISEGGKRRNVTTQKAVLLRLREKALKGDAKAIDQLVALAGAYNNEALTPSADMTLDSDDAAVLDAFLTRKTSPKGSDGDA